MQLGAFSITQTTHCVLQKMGFLCVQRHIPEMPLQLGWLKSSATPLSAVLLPHQPCHQQASCGGHSFIWWYYMALSGNLTSSQSKPQPVSLEKAMNSKLLVLFFTFSVPFLRQITMLLLFFKQPRSTQVRFSASTSNMSQTSIVSFFFQGNFSIQKTGTEA